MLFETRTRPDRWKGFVTGLVGGVAGTIGMGYYWKIVTGLAGKDPRTLTTANGPHQFDSISLLGKNHADDESSTMALGRIFYNTISKQVPQSKETKALLSNLVHYTYGSLQPGLYGAFRADKQGLDLNGGVVFGTILWLGGDELAVSLLGLADGPTKFPISQHLHRWGAHLTYGLISVTLARLLYRWL